MSDNYIETVVFTFVFTYKTRRFDEKWIVDSGENIVYEQGTILLTFQLIVNNVREVGWRGILMKKMENPLVCDF